MDYYLTLMFLVAAVGLGALLLTSAGEQRRARLLRRLRHTPLPDHVREVLERIPHYRLLPEGLKSELHPRMLCLLEEKEIRGVGKEIDDEVRAVLSFYAALLVVGIPDECYERLSLFLVYPGEVLARWREEEGGIRREIESVLEGQASEDTVLIAWSEARREAYQPRDANVILHELAHTLDFEDGIADGAPPMGRELRRSWSHTLSRHFQILRQRIETGEPPGAYRLLGEYAATDDTEFFAVLTERYFTVPLSLRRAFPDLYGELRKLYRFDSAEIYGALEKRFTESPHPDADRSPGGPWTPID